MWFDESVFYQIYPLGFCGAPKDNDGQYVNRIRKLGDWTGHLQKLHVSALYLSPIFESDRHGYDTRDYCTVDCRLGNNKDFSEVVSLLHHSGIRVVLDGVFHHVGRGFWAFLDVLEKREASPYKDWFFIDFNRNSCYNDGLWYDGWEGHYELVRLNLSNPAVTEHLLGAVRFWIEEFQIDGLRLDVAYSLDSGFLRQLRAFCDRLKPDFALIGEVLFGDYNRLVGSDLLHSCTNYECYKGIFSSLNDNNLFEITYSLNRQFGSENWCLYRGKHLLSFVDNHDVSRIASILNNKNHIRAAYALMFCMPGVPCIYYGSEWGLEGDKSAGDDVLRPCPKAPEWNDLTEFISVLSALRREHPAFSYGAYRNVLVNNKQCVFERSVDNDCIRVAVNLADTPFDFQTDGVRTELLTGTAITDPQITLAPFGVGVYTR